MSDQAPTASPAPAAPTDPKRLREQILRDVEQAMSREPGDRVRCVHLFSSYFRCNWWSPMPARPEQNRSFDWSTGSTHYVRKSAFLRVDAEAGKLTIEEVDLPRPR